MKVNFEKLSKLKKKYGKFNISLKKALFLEQKEVSTGMNTSKIQK